MKNTIINDFFSYGTFWLKYMQQGVINRHDYLTSLLKSGSYDDLVKQAGRFAGRRSGWHLEKGLLDRVISAGFGRLVKDFGQLKQTDFDEQLAKSEKQMVEKPQFNGSNKKLLEAALRVKIACKFPENKFTPVNFNTAADLQLNHQSSSGFPKFIRKGKIIPELIEQAKELLNNPNSQQWTWPCTRGYRIQLRESEGTVKRKIRIMYPYPGCLILLENSFIMPFVQHFITTNTFYVIGRTGKEIGELLKTVLYKSDQVVSLDVSSYDQTLVNEAILAAFFIVRQQLLLTKEESIAFDNMVKYFCVSIMVSKVPGERAYAFVKNHGIPSGSGFTNMIGTLAHAIILEYLSPGLINKALICGDDNIFDSKNVDSKQLFEGYKKSFNLTVDPVKTDFYKSSLNVKFLGFKFKNYIRYVSPLLVINQTVWHSSYLELLDPFERELSRAASVLLNGINGKELFSKIFPDVIHQLNQGIDVRFNYLLGNSPPSALEGMGKLKTKNSTFSDTLSEHLEYGYLIR